MSHFSRLKVQVKNEGAAHRVADKFGWSISREANYVNSWNKSEVVNNCDVYRDADGRVKMVVDSSGTVTHDAFSMGRDANKFLCAYSEEFIRTMAAAEGAEVKNLGEDKHGNLVLEVAYLY
jgi:hypothetical protein